MTVRSLAFAAFVAFAGAWIAAGCSPASVVRAPDDHARDPGDTRTDGELESLLRGDPELAAALDDAPRRRVQVLVAIPTEDADGHRALRRIGFRADAEYFYPASAVKLAAAVAALEKLDEQKDARGRNLVSLATPLRVTEGDARRRKAFETTLREEVEKSLVVSDNDAHNRLFELVGRSELAERVARLGLSSTRIVHRLGEGDVSPPAFEWLPPSGEPILVAQRLGFEPPAPVNDDGVLVGTAHVDEAGRLVAGPMDFSAKNRMPLRELQDVLVATVRPDLAQGQLPRLAPQDRAALLAILGMLPSELRPSRYSPERDELHKPMHVAILRSLPDDRIRVLSKGGRAFGFAIENAYAVDETTGRAFFVAAAMYANGNETLNDDRYDYRTIADPFMTRLGETLARALLAGARRSP